MRRPLTLALVGACVLAQLLARLAYAQGAIGDGGLDGQPITGPLPSYLVRDANGQIHFDTSGLTPGEPIVLDPPPGYWSAEATIPGTPISVCAGCLVYNTYTTATGETVVVPNAYTAVVMAVSGYSPFTGQPDLAIGNGLLQLAAMAGAFEGMGIPAEEMTLENLARRFDPTSNEFDPWFMLQLNLALNDPNNPLNSGAFFWAAGLFQFSCDPLTGECPDTTVPARPPEDPLEARCLQLGDCQPLTGVCPARDFQISVPAPVYTALKLLPEHPIVVGQDPEKRGVDLRAGVTVPPVTVSYNVEREYPGERECRWVGGGQGGGCPAGTKGFEPWMAADVDWGAVDTSRKVCERVTKVYPDPVATFSVLTRLDEASIAWITTGDLQSRYPGAKVYQANWPLWPGLPPLRQAVAPDRTSLLLDWERVPLKDPGRYHLVLTGRTTGTPYTAPRPLNYDEVVYDVALLEAALIK